VVSVRQSVGYKNPMGLIARQIWPHSEKVISA